MKSYDLHIPQQGFWGTQTPMALAQTLALAVQRGVRLQILPKPIPNGLNEYEAAHPDAAVLFDVETEDLIAVETTP
jgi:hypothetical protein